MNIYDISLKNNNGQDLLLETYKDKVLLVVNVTNYLGITSHHKKLENLYKKYHSKGLEILGIASDDFKPILKEIGIDINYSFNVSEKLSVKGIKQHPLYKILTHEAPDSLGQFYSLAKKAFVVRGIDQGHDNDVMWNFEKFLVAKNGTMLGRFASDIAADDPRFIECIEKEINCPV